MSNADCKNSIDQRGSANSDEEDDADDGDDEDVVDRDELERVLLPIVVDLAAAATKKISSRYHKIVKDQVYHEYQIYAKSNRTDFIHRLAQEAWPEAAQQAKDSCRIYEQNIKYVHSGVFPFFLCRLLYIQSYCSSK